MKHFLLHLALLCFCNYAYTQNAELTGNIHDAETNEPLSGATIRFDKTKGALSDVSGKFKLSLPAGEHVITVSFIGYKNLKDTITLAAGEKKDVTYNVKPNAIQINQVVSVSQYRKNSARETVSVEVVSQEQIKNTNARDLSEVINKTPGVLVQDGQISIRGANSYTYGVGSRTMVLQDGLALMSADLQEGQNNMAALSNVKQVEIIKGASSVAYGAGAINGVVNLITQWPTGSEPQTEISLNSGGYEAPAKKYQKWWDDGRFFTNINVNHMRREKDLQIVLGGNVTYDQSYLSLNDNFRVQGLFRLRYLSPKIPGLNFGIGGSIQKEMSERFFIAANLDTGIYQRGAGSGDEYIRTNIDPFVNWQNSKGHRVTSFWRYMNIFRKGNPPDPNAVSHQLMSNTQYQYKFKNMLIITAGLPFTIGYSSSNLYPGLNRTYNVGPYVQAEFEYKFLSVQAGVRYEIASVDTVTVGIPVFRSGINMRAASATFFRASWGQGFRVPSIAERYIAQPFQAGVLIVPNDTLKVERSWNLELGFKQGFKIGKWGAYLDLAFFWQQSKNFIEYNFGLWPNKWGDGSKQIFPDSMEIGYPKNVNPPPTSWPSDQVIGLKPLNIENTRIVGYEISIGGNGNIGPVGIRLLAGYTYLWPTKYDTSQHYSVGQMLGDMFKYNFRKADSAGLTHLLNQRVRHLVRADIELSYWKCYLGATFSYGSSPEKWPALYKAVATAIFKDADAITKYSAEHDKGDFYFDMRAGVKITDKLKLGFIVKNITNRVYVLRIGKPEPTRNYTVQLTYTF